MSGGKPVGFKLCIGMPWEFMAIVKAMMEEDNYPDFIVIDGAEGGTGAAPVEFMDSIGMPLVDAFIFVQNTLVGAGICDKIKVGVSGKLISGFDIAKMMALGAIGVTVPVALCLRWAVFNHVLAIPTNARQVSPRKTHRVKKR